MSVTIDVVCAGQAALCAVIAHRMALTLMEAPKFSFQDAMAQLEFARGRLDFYLDSAKCQGRVWVARIDGENVGHTMGMADRDESGPYGHMGTFYVVPGFRRHGIALAMLKTNSEWLTSLGLPRIVYRTAEDYEPMQKLLLAEGFVRRPAKFPGFAEFERTTPSP